MGKRVASGTSIRAKAPKHLAVPYRAISKLESIACGFRHDLVVVTTEGPLKDSGIFSGAGFGSPWITLKWGERQATIHGVELLAAWVRTFDPKQADEIEAAIVNATEVSSRIVQS